MAESNSDDAPIGFKAPPLKDVQVKFASKFGASVPSVPKAVAPTVAAAPARNTTLEQVVRRTKSVALAKEPSTVPKEKQEQEVPVVGQEEEQEGPQMIISELPFLRKTTGLPAVPVEGPHLEDDELTVTLKQRIAGTDPVQAKPGKAEGYRPITSADFPDFVVQTYEQYSPYIQRVLKEGAAAAAIPKELDKDACKNRDPNKIQTFYYQSFVRDYLSSGTPYRGLLVYHGLGTGKTCTSIAAAEALYWGGQKKIFVLTPATLSNNYRKDLGKCGYFPLRQNNFWAFLESKEGGPSYAWLVHGLGLPEALVRKQGGGWVPDPDKPSNWETLSSENKESVRAQQRAHLNHRFKFIHYNGVTPTVLSQLAAAGVADGTSMFDDAVVVIDEIHNLVRTINGTQLGGKPISQIIETVEPRETTWSTPLGRERPGYRYPRGYTLYRLLQNAVGAKIVALSATPMINYAQELAILMNIIGGEQRMVEISLSSASRDPTTTARLEEWARKRPDIDFFKIEEATDRTTVLNVTPVPYGFVKVVGADYATRGFVRVPPMQMGSVKTSRERTLDLWAESLTKELQAQGLVAAPTSKLRVFPMLPEDAKVFVANFVDRNTLKILNANVLKARAYGLISYYRGGSEELMPRTGRNEVVEVPMSEFMFKQYSLARLAELEMEAPVQEVEEGKGAKKGQKGMTKAEVDLYTQATKSQQTGFLALSRAACNWVFPEEVPRPKVSVKDQVKLLGAEQNRLIDADLSEDMDTELNVGPSALAEEAEVEKTDAVLPDEVVQEEPTPLSATLAGIIGTLMSGLEAKADDYLNTALATYSPKYATMVANIRESPGPALVYSQFKTLEGLGIFAAVLRASPEQYLPLDIQKIGGEWAIPEPLMVADRPRYILYTGDQEAEKRKLLLQLYNADLASLLPKLAEQCKALLAGAEDNRDGRICRVFMITQSGAEGISLFNTRQVHIMEPYWNNVRLQQVIGRAIRLCSHMNLPWDDRVVDVFTYLSVFSAQQKAEGSKVLMKVDKAMTTDQMIFDIATKKQKLADGLFEIAQSAAVDCQLHYEEHKAGLPEGQTIKCYKFAEGGRPMFMYHPDWHKDLQASVRPT
jgi:hypothetical protein